MYLRTLLLSFMLFLSLRVPADDAAIQSHIQTLASRKSSERAVAFDALVATGDARLVPFFDAYRIGSIYLRDGVPFIGGDVITDNNLDQFVSLTHVLTGETMLNEQGEPELVSLLELENLSPNRKERIKVRSVSMLLNLSSPDNETRLNAAKKAGMAPLKTEAIPILSELAEGDASKKIRHTAAESLALLELGTSDDADLRMDAIRRLGELDSLRALSLLENMLEKDETLTPKQTAIVLTARKHIMTHQQKVKFFDNFKFGLSTGSIYILMALGLAIIYGLMGVINMAHGEMMMIGAYTTFVLQKVFGHGPETPQNHFFLVALPASFLVAALVGWVIERLVVRKLYHRPFESLLATVGVSFILIQVVRLIFGDNQSSNSPTWLVGGFEVANDMTLSFNRVFIFFLTMAAVTGVMVLMRYTTFGLKVRATMQHREMAASVGIHTRRMYSMTFMLGSGLAGLAGCALTTVSGITPDMGQNYIVDSFLIVVIGGVGELVGVVCSGLGMGIILQSLENSFFSPVWAKIIILTMVVAFIQFRPAGLFPPKGRLADV
ncbi:urea ABC transporter permease subunit UrtB [Kiritimatiellaeota bacterium B1221]|nr:urea ABC transporter permease subunit UrtB [Kiritimatiellaeota bacterium B1221]